MIPFSTLTSNSTVMKVFVFLEILPSPTSGTYSKTDLSGFVSSDGLRVIVCSAFPFNAVNVLSVSYVIHVNDSLFTITYSSPLYCPTCSDYSSFGIGVSDNTISTIIGFCNISSNYQTQITLNVLPTGYISLNIQNVETVSLQTIIYAPFCPANSSPRVIDC